MIKIPDIKKEFCINEKISNKQYFHDIDPGFMKDSTYKCIYLYKDNTWRNTDIYKITIKELKKTFKHKIVQSFFSIMNGSKFIAPHKNKCKDDQSVRYHFGIIVHNNENAYLKVKQKKYYWKENEWFVFNTHDIHSVYKPKPYKRVLLIVDVLQ